MDIRISMVEAPPRRNSPSSPGIIPIMLGSDDLFAPRQVSCH